MMVYYLSYCDLRILQREGLKLEATIDKMYASVENYIKSFYTEDRLVQEHIELKEQHTYLVAKYCRQLASHLALAEHDVILAEMIGLFHDIGRFRQFEIYKTFNDRKSENHSLLGLREIADLVLLENLSAEDLAVFKFAITNHNAIEIDSNGSERQQLFSKIIRDADKIDIYRVLEPTLVQSSDDGYSEIFAKAFLEGKQCDYTYMKTTEDRKLVRLLWLYNINYQWSMEQILSQGHFMKIAATLPENEITVAGIKKLKAYLTEKYNINS